MNIWIHHVPHHAAVIQLSAKESVVPHAMVSILTYFLMSLTFNSSKHNEGLYLFPQNVSMTGGCMLMEKCSSLQEVDPAYSAGVRQVQKW